jgi:hypothetical protein
LCTKIDYELAKNLSKRSKTSAVNIYLNLSKAHFPQGKFVRATVRVGTDFAGQSHCQDLSFASREQIRVVENGLNTTHCMAVDFIFVE